MFKKLPAILFQTEFREMSRRQQDQIRVVVPHIQKGLSHRRPLIRRPKAGGQQPLTPLVLRPIFCRGHIGKIIGAQWRTEQISSGDCRKTRAFRESAHIHCPGMVDKFIFQAVGIGRREAQKIVINPIEAVINFTSMLKLLYATRLIRDWTISIILHGR